MCTHLSISICINLSISICIHLSEHFYLYTSKHFYLYTSEHLYTSVHLYISEHLYTSEHFLSDIATVGGEGAGGSFQGTFKKTKAGRIDYFVEWDPGTINSTHFPAVHG